MFFLQVLVISGVDFTSKSVKLRGKINNSTSLLFFAMLKAAVAAVIFPLKKLLKPCVRVMVGETTQQLSSKVY